MSNRDLVPVDLDWSARYPRSFYAQDPCVVAPALLGATVVHTDRQGVRRAGMVVETEAYRGEEDQACHARVGRTKRTAPMYGAPGRSYVYLIYGMYNMLNVVTWPEGEPSAVLIRALAPVEGTNATMDGPGKLCRELHIDRSHNNEDLLASTLFIIPGKTISPQRIATSTRVGIAYAGDWASRPWRFAIRGHRCVSRPRI